MPELYHRHLGPALFQPFARQLATAVVASAPHRVLELAAGTGIATDELVRQLPHGSIHATDLNPAMAGTGRARVPGASWATASAEHLPFPDRSFDAVAMQFGIMFFPDQVRALAESRRVLSPAGTVVFTAWDRVEESPFPAAMVESLVAVLPDDPPDFIVRVPHGYHDPARMRADLISAGLQPVDVQRVVLSGRAESARSLTEGFCYGTPLRHVLQQRGSLDQVVDRLADEMTRRLGDGEIEGDLAAFVVTATPR